MNSNDLNDLFDILTDLQNEFLVEEKKLKEISSTHAYRIDELDQQINTARKNEDIDFRVFSPRSLSIDNSNKIKALEEEKGSLEREKADADKQMSYYTGKADRLTKAVNIVKAILKSEIKVGGIDNEPTTEISSESIIEEDTTTSLLKKKPYNNFAFLYEDEKDEDSEINDKELDKVEKLFAGDDEIDDNEKVSLDIESIDSNENVSEKSECNGVPIDEVERVCHKVEITEKIINNDRVRAKMQLKDVITELKDLIKAYK